MKRFILPLLALALICGVNLGQAFAQPAASLTRVEATHPPVTKHKAHKAGRHHTPKRQRAHRRRGV